jgi:hypothetical protein
MGEVAVFCGHSLATSPSRAPAGCWCCRNSPRLRPGSSAGFSERGDPQGNLGIPAASAREPRFVLCGLPVVDHANCDGAIAMRPAPTSLPGVPSVNQYRRANTIMNLTTQDQQVACFRNVAAHLEPGGCFVIEVMVPELQRLPPGETVHAFAVTPSHLGFEEYDVATQIAVSHHLLGGRWPT